MMTSLQAIMKTRKKSKSRTSLSINTISDMKNQIRNLCVYISLFVINWFCRLNNIRVPLANQCDVRMKSGRRNVMRIKKGKTRFALFVL
jgi:hypothetical protein